MPILSDQIADRLAKASADTHQRIAEAIAKILFPDRFARLNVYGRNFERQTIKGWPDAYIVTDEGGLDGVEATRDHSWESHLESDFKKLEADKRWKGLVVVCAYPRERVSPLVHLKWQNQFVAAGIEPEKFALIVGLEVVNLLCEPRFARVRLEHLGLSPTPEVFQPTSFRSRASFEPTEREYYEGIVYRPSIANNVERALADFGLAAVLGLGASGKSVLGKLIALSTRFQQFQSYNLKLATGDIDLELSNQISKDMIEFGSPNSLFVLDDAHLVPSLVSSVLENWRDLGQARPPLLLLARDTGPLRKQLELENGTEIIELRAAHGEVKGTLERLVKRSYPWSEEIGPPEEIIDTWVKTFGGKAQRGSTSVDLVALSAAIEFRLIEIKNGDWKLTEEHAADSVRKHYLIPLSEKSVGELANVRRLAALPEDFYLKESTLPNRLVRFEASLNQGLVFESFLGKDKFRHFSFAHGALGRLIKAADPLSEDEESAHLAVARSDGSVGLYLASALRVIGDVDFANSLLQKMSFEGVWFNTYRGHLGTLRTDLLQFRKCGSTEFVSAINSVTINSNHLLDQALVTPLDSLINFLTFTERLHEGEHLRHALNEVLATDENARRLSKKALQSPIGHLVHFLTFIDRRKDLKVLKDSLSTELCKENNVHHLLKQAIQSSFQQLTNFLIHIERRTELKGLKDALDAELCKESSIHHLSKKALQSSLRQLTDFLTFIDRRKELKDLKGALNAELCEEENVHYLLKRVLHSPLEVLTYFLTFIERREELKALKDALNAELCKEENAHDLFKCVLQSPLDQLARFLKFTTESKLFPSVAEVAEMTKSISNDIMAQKVVDASLTSITSLGQCHNDVKGVLALIDLDEWNAKRSMDAAESPAFIKSTYEFFKNNERPELAHMLAATLIRAKEVATWNGNGVTLVHMTMAVWLARNHCTSKEIFDFVELVVSPEWLDNQYGNPRSAAGALGAALLSVRLNQPKTLWAQYYRDSFRKRLLFEINNANTIDLEKIAGLIGLLGAHYFMWGTLAIDNKVVWMDDDNLMRQLVEHQKVKEGIGLSPKQTCFWYGMMSARKLRRSSFSIDLTNGNLALEQCKLSQEKLEEAQRKLKQEEREAQGPSIYLELQSWLQNCSNRSWRVQ